MKITSKIYVDEKLYDQSDDEVGKANALEFVHVWALTALQIQAEDFPSKTVTLHIYPEFGKGLFILRFGFGGSITEDKLAEFVDHAWPKRCEQNNWKF